MVKSMTMKRIIAENKNLSSWLVKGCLVYLGIFPLCCIVVWLGFCLQSLKPPKAPIYPGSELNTQSLREADISILTTYYNAPGSPEEIRRFYEKNGATCWEPDTSRDSGKIWQRCEGKLRLQDQYFVYIDIDSYSIDGTTAYRFEIWWRKCSLRLSL